MTFTNIANNVSDANIALEAAALVGTVASPDFSLTAAPRSQSVAVGGSTDLHGDSDGAERVHGEHGLRGKRAADGSDGEFQSDDGDRDGIVHHDGDDEREARRWVAIPSP